MTLFNAASASDVQGAVANTVAVPVHQRRKHRTGEDLSDTGVRDGPEGQV